MPPSSRPSKLQGDRRSHLRARTALEKDLTAVVGGTSLESAAVRLCSASLVAASQEAAPVQLSSVARSLGAEIIYNDDSERVGEEEASLTLSAGRVSLWVSRAKFQRSPSRARFSIAHEISHLLLIRSLGPEIIDRADGDPAVYDTVERLCDLMASNILVPRHHLSLALRERGLGRASVASLANLFQISRETLFRAIPDLVPDGALIEWRRYKRKPSEAFGWRVWKSYRRSDAQDFSSWLPAGCTLAHMTRIGAVEDMAIDTPIARPGIFLVKGKREWPRDAVLCRWGPNDRYHQPTLDGGAEVQGSQSSPPDCFLAVVGQRGRVDFAQFGAGAI